jgi:hypothetical protein
MWPWEHLAVGYLLYSAYAHGRYGRPPAAGAVPAVVLASQLPDLIDKPLAWTLGILPAGYSLGHSVFFGGTLFVVGGLVLGRLGMTELWGAAMVGYWSHLLGDLLYPLARGGDVDASILLWPLVQRPVEPPTGLIPEASRLFVDFVTFLGTPRGLGYLLLEMALVGGVVVLWVADGRPGSGWRTGRDGDPSR